jgi:hypothetical protein
MQTRSTADTPDPANAAVGGYDHLSASSSPGVQSDTNVGQQGDETVTGDHWQDKLDKETAATATPNDRPTAADDPGAQRDIDVRQQVQGNGPLAATGTSVHDMQTPSTADTPDPVNAATGGYDRLAASSSPGVRSDTDVRQKGDETVTGESGDHWQGKLDKGSAATASPSDRPTAADDPGAQRDIDVRQQVQGNGPATGTSVHDMQTRSTADTPDLANAAVGGYDRLSASSSPGVQSDTDVRQQGDETVTGDHWQDKLDKETAATASPSDRPTEVDGPGAQRDVDVRQQVQGNGPAFGTSVRDMQTPTTADTPDPANTAAGGYDRPAASSSPGVQSDTDMRLQGNRTVAGDQDKLDKETAATAAPSDRPTAADDPGTQRDINFRQHVQGNGPATGTSVHDMQTRTTADAPDPANAAAGGYDRPAASSSPGVRGDTDVRQQGDGSASSDRDKAQETRTTADTKDPVNTAAGQERLSQTAPQA